MKNILDLSLLGKSFPTPKGNLRVVHDFNLKIKTGEFVSLIGHSGCGKSTVLSMVAGLEQPTTGGSHFFGAGSGGCRPRSRCRVPSSLSAAMDDGF